MCRIIFLDVHNFLRNVRNFLLEGKSDCCDAPAHFSRLLLALPQDGISGNPGSGISGNRGSGISGNRGSGLSGNRGRGISGNRGRQLHQTEFCLVPNQL